MARVTPNAGAVSRQCRASPASPPVRPFAPSTAEGVYSLCSPPSSLLWPDLIARPRASTDYGIALSVAVPAWPAQSRALPGPGAGACVREFFDTAEPDDGSPAVPVLPSTNGKASALQTMHFSVLNSSAHLPRCRRFTARLATSRARLAELRGVACSFAVEERVAWPLVLPKHSVSLAHRHVDAVARRATPRPPIDIAFDAATGPSWTTRARARSPAIRSARPARPPCTGGRLPRPR